MNYKSLQIVKILVLISFLLSGCSNTSETIEFRELPSVQLLIAQPNETNGGIVSVNWSSQPYLTLQGMTQSDWPIYVSNVKQGNLIVITYGGTTISGYSPTISPNGKYLAFASYASTSSDSRIHIWEISQFSPGQLVLGQRILSLDNHNYSSLAWSPDSQELALIQHISNGLRLHIYDISGMKLQQLAEYHEKDIRTIGGMAWASDGERLAFFIEFDVIDKDEARVQSDVFVYLIEEYRFIRLMTSDNISEESPTWYPMGEILTYTSTYRGDAKLLDSSLVFSTSDGRCSKVLPKLIGIASPAWSPDGTKIAFVSTEGVEIMDSTQAVPQEYLSVEYLCDEGK